MPKADFDAIKKSILRCLSSTREIQAAYIFGSVASGRTRKDSDIDIAVLIRKNEGHDTLKYRLKLMADLGSALHRSDVDVVILNEAPPLLAHRGPIQRKADFREVRFSARALSGRHGETLFGPCASIRNAYPVPEKERSGTANYWLTVI